jgi:hypothetical protein
MWWLDKANQVRARAFSLASLKLSQREKTK